MYSRTYQDRQNLHNGLIGKVFYELNPRNKDEFRTVRVGWAALANKMILQYSNGGVYTRGTPPDGMLPINPRLRSAITTMQPQRPEMY